MRTLLFTVSLIAGSGSLIGCSGSSPTPSTPEQSSRVDNRGSGQPSQSRPIGQPNTPRIPKPPPK